jgi:hypothetical protein
MAKVRIIFYLHTYKESWQMYAIIDLFSPAPFVIMNQCWIIDILKRFIPGKKILTLYFLLTFSEQN